MSPFNEPNDIGIDAAARAMPTRSIDRSLRQDVEGEALAHAALPPPRKRPFPHRLLP